MPQTKPVSLAKLARYPFMTRWFGLPLLGKLLWRVIVSELFGQYADSRLIVAALDPVKEGEHFDRAVAHVQGKPDGAFTLDEEGALWIDYVADLGDGFDSTYAVASLMARETLTLDGHATRRGRLLVMGGDEVYPTATAETYQRQLRDPYEWALTDATVPEPKPLVFAIPGNHDWYDGLVVFLGLFTRRQRLQIGGWRSRQNRSYFALKLTGDWWLWAVDAQLDDTIDQPQRDYFSAIAQRMDDNARVILCGPKPGWLYVRRPEWPSLGVYDLLGRILAEHRPQARIALVLSGDTHHYSRYRAPKTGVNFVTSGGGGAFLHPTHHLKKRIAVNGRDERSAIGFVRADDHLTLARDSRTHAPSVYPTIAESRRMLWRVWTFSLLNPSFAGAIGAFYAAFLPLAAHWPVFGALTATGAAWWALAAYADKQEGGRWRVRIASFLHALGHGALFTLVAQAILRASGGWEAQTAELLAFARPLLEARLDIVATWLAWAGRFGIMGGFGWAVGGALFGGYLHLTSRFLDINHNDAFSAMRRNSHRHFLRIRIKGDTATVFPIGLDRTPRRSAWRRIDKPTRDQPCAYVAEPPLAPRLIETPYDARAGNISA